MTDLTTEDREGREASAFLSRLLTELGTYVLDMTPAHREIAWECLGDLATMAGTNGHEGHCELAILLNKLRRFVIATGNTIDEPDAVATTEGN